MIENFSYLFEKINHDEQDDLEYPEDDFPSVSITLTDNELVIPSDDKILKTDDLGIIQNKAMSNYILIKLINLINLKSILYTPLN
jgi:hypothetical protein